MDVFEAIRGRRTVKAFAPEPLDDRALDELLELARWAPNHRLTWPWRFRVVGPQALHELKRVAAELAVANCPPDADRQTVTAAAAAKLDRAPTLVVVSCVRSGDHVQHDEDVLATGVAAYIVLLAAHARGFAGYWRTPEVLRCADGRAAVSVGDDEEIIGLLHLGRVAQQPGAAPERPRPSTYVTRLS
jgi:nitroreductase